MNDKPILTYCSAIYCSPRLLCVAKIKLGNSLVVIEMQVVLNFVVASAKIFTIWL